MKIRTYSELRHLHTFDERYEYLKLSGRVGADTFGFDRHINQAFYRSSQWRNIRKHVILRDNGCDLGIDGFEIHDSVYIHHMNPMLPKDIIHGDADILDPEFLISVTHSTHNAIHYGSEYTRKTHFVERKPGDHIPWR